MTYQMPGLSVWFRHMAIAAHPRRLIPTGLMILLVIHPSYAQNPSPITSSGLNTQVTQVGENQYSITGGTRPGSNTNLFHSFGEFGVPANGIANFLNETSLPTDNILGRVTGGNPSNIFGIVQTQGFGNANFFLMNPAGILFGPNASLNVGGTVAFTTANNIRLNDSAVFNALPGPADTLLSAAPVAAFGFLGSNPGDITIHASNLSVNPGQAINLVGGNISIQPPESSPDAIQPVRISAPEGQIHLVSVASAGEIPASSFQPDSNIALGSIKLGPGTLVNVSGDGAGTVRIRGGTLIMDNAMIMADTGESHGAPIAVDIGVTNDVSFSSNRTSVITARTTRAGNAGEIRVSSSKVNVDFAFSEFGVMIDSSTVGSGNAGKVTIATGDLTATNNNATEFVNLFIDSGTGGIGNGGDVTIKLQKGNFKGSTINTGDAFFFGAGTAGNLYIGGHNRLADYLHFDSLVLNTEAFNAKGGAITLEGHHILIENNTSVSSTSLQGGNPITIVADRLVMDNVVRVQASTLGVGDGGNIVFHGNRVEMTNESAFITRTRGDGNGGTIRVFADDRVIITDDPLERLPAASLPIRSAISNWE